jgi:hypothetical protein
MIYLFIFNQIRLLEEMIIICAIKVGDPNLEEDLYCI